MDKNSARERLRAIGMDEDMIDEVIPLIVAEQEPVNNGLSATQREEHALRAELAFPASTDEEWRRRATMAARVISLGLDS